MKRLIAFLCACVVTVSLSANPVSKESARKLAERFLQQKGIQVGSEAARARGGKTTAGYQPLYVFNTVDDRGFVIVSGDDCAEPILGYTTRGHFDEANIPENFRSWLEDMTAEIEAVSQQPKTRGSGVAPVPQQVAIHAAVSPMIVTQWDQGNTDNVYNALLPLVGGQSPCTGCVATAGAQVMYYYRWPEAPTQVVPGYTLSKSYGADTSGDLPSVTFQWDKMLAKYNRRENSTPLTVAEEAVATLMLYCAYAAQMNFHPGGSSASTSTLSDGMCQYFDYNPNSWKNVYRSDYTIADWDALIYNELANGRPIIYSGSSFNGGHAFICDGYDGAGLYHFNWGWGGDHNGYFKLQATNPYGKTDISDVGYISDNYCIIGLQPNSWPYTEDPNADDEWEVPVVEGLVATASNITVDGTIVTMSLGNKNEETAAFGFGIGELNADGSISVVSTENEMYKDWGELPNNYSWTKVKFDFSTYGLSEGSHMLVPICIIKGETEWKRCKSGDVYFEVTVSGGAMTIVGHPVESLQIDEFSLASGGSPGSRQTVRLSMTNLGDNIEKKFYIYKGTAENMGEYAGSVTVKIASGNTKTYTTSIGKLDAGNYTLYLTTQYGGDQYMAKTDITIEQDLKATSFDISGLKFTNNLLEVNVTVENNASEYASPLYLFASQYGSLNLVYAAGSAIERGSSENVLFYFQPSAPGSWTLLVTTDSEGTNVIGQTTVEIEAPPSGEITLTASDQKAVFGENDVTYSFTVSNTGGTLSYRDLETWLFVYDEKGVGWSVSNAMTPLILGPGEAKTITLHFDGLEEGSRYGIVTYYYLMSESDNQSQVDRYPFVFKKPSGGGETAKGDVNGDSRVNGTDIQAVINVITDEEYSEEADINKDNKVNGTDIQEIINIIVEE